jgi:flagellar hook-associated protein 2
MKGGDEMSSINSYLYNNYSSDYSSYSTQMVKSAQRSTWRGGVTGWEPKVDNPRTQSYGKTSSTSKAGSYLSSVKAFGTKINNAIAGFNGGKKQTSVFDLLKGMSSNDALSVNVKDQRAASAFKATGRTKEVEINQLAAKQQNKGSALSSSAIGNRTTGRNVFEMETGGKKFSFNVNVNATDSNRTVQEKMAAAINSQNTGVTANVVYNEKDKTSSLTLTARDSGEEKAFEIQDKEGNLAEYTGADRVSTRAQDAVYTVDGEERRSATNEADLGDGLTGTLKKITDGAAEVSAGYDQTEITNSVYEMVDGFNQLRELAADRSDDRGAKSLQQRLDSLTSAYKTTLGRAGISLNKDGYMEIDKQKLETAIGNGQAESVFGENSGFTRSLSSTAKTAEQNPERFLSYEARNSKSTSESFNFDDYLSSAKFSPFQTNRLNQWNNMGMLFSALA